MSNTMDFDCGSTRLTFIKYKSVIAEIMKISYRTEAQYINTAKLNKFSFNMAQKLLSGEECNTNGAHTQYCVMSKVTDAGYEYQNGELDGFKIIAVDDEYGAAADEMLNIIKNEAVSRRADIICCYNPFLQYSLERIIVNRTKIAVCRSSKFCRVPNAYRRIHCDRFLDKKALSNHRQSLRFNDKIIKELLKNCHQNAE